ncbi:hypothetical protein SAMN05660236_0410 [Ohtaekwangia koreensis]|uniref:NAD glycohydrolase translocation F5/8 type C domain-containing protein n=2 Tax=Ohtaekwangia koreensis TaxID=688867 RepID=A0A1T5IUP3_9BACT|nr:hypothetical protein SAMN05660236_0410 [Ohtaekwangia koreensis]
MGSLHPMMRSVLFILLLISVETFGQDNTRRTPTLGHQVDLSAQDDAKYKKDKFIDVAHYDIVGYSFDSQRASSELTSDSIDYSAKNAADLSFKTAWVEGVQGYGVGESLTFGLQSNHPAVTKIVVVNGFVKSKEEWAEYSRVKVLEMLVNGIRFEKLNLADTRQLQEFSLCQRLDPICERTFDNRI